VLLHALTNDIKDHSPEQCTEKLGEVVQLISSKWKNTKTIVSLTTPRNDSEMHCVNSEILDGLIKRNFLAQENVIICDNENMWHSNISQNQLLKDDKFHLSDKGTSMLAANMKRMLHSSLGIRGPPQSQRNEYNGRNQRGTGGNQNYERQNSNNRGNGNFNGQNMRNYGNSSNNRRNWNNNGNRYYNRQNGNNGDYRGGGRTA